MNIEWKLIINYSLDDGTLLETSYKLHKSPYLDLWINQWKNYSLRSFKPLYAWFINKSKKDVPNLFKRIKEVLKILKTEDGIDIIDAPPEFDQKSFNEWHHIFEQNVHVVSKEKNHLYMELNELIHTIESLCAVHTQKDLNFRSIIGVLGHKDALPLKPEYQCFSHHNDQWGDLVMSYATTGKNWAEAAFTNDIEIVKIKGITNKTIIRQEFITNFYQKETITLTDHTIQFEQLSRIYYWYDSLPDDLKENVPIDNLNELFFRNLFLGYIEVQKLPNVNFNRYLESNSYRKEFQKNFNLNYFGKVTKVHSLIFEHQIIKDKTFRVNNYE